MTDKLTPAHLARRAIVYVRQSTAAQMFDHRESTARQYALVERAAAVGWPRAAIEVIDEDQGRSGATTVGRTGFARLVDAVAHGHVGAILALEVSRLARASEDWQRLLALCAVAQVLVLDEQAIYDPNAPDDKLLLDLKGTMSEAELHWLALRLAGARLNKARRGELHVHPPTGYVWTDHGFAVDPDEAVRAAIQVVFDRYAIEPSAWAVVRWARTAGFTLPTRQTYADGTTAVTWAPLGVSRLHEMLRNPTYAGVYAYSRRPTTKVLRDGRICHVRSAGRDPAQWTVRRPDAHPGYITWESFMRNQEKLRQNYARLGLATRGAPRNGAALLHGLLVCGRCGRRMHVAYNGRHAHGWSYVCCGARDHGQVLCWSVSGRPLDAAVEALFLQTVVPPELALSLAVEREVDHQTAALDRHWQTRLEQARYEARRAERRYKAVDPDNRVVARTLEREWEARLHDLAQVDAGATAARHVQHVDLTADDRTRIRALAQDLPAVWRAPTTRPADRKAMLRLVIDAIALTPVDVPARATRVQVQWRSGVVSELQVARPDRRVAGKPAASTLARLRELAAAGLHDEAIATQLNAAGLTTGAMKPWTAWAVKWARRRAQIPRTAPDRPRSLPLPDRHPDGRYSVGGAAKRFGVSTEVVRRWLQEGLVTGRREPYGQYANVWWLDIDRATEARLRALRVRHDAP
jgi:DNA invertase Pin-like site-specific DNA recombinase